MAEKYSYRNNRSIPYKKLLKPNYLYMNIVISYINLFGNFIFWNVSHGRRRILESKGEGGRREKENAIQQTVYLCIPQNFSKWRQHKQKENNIISLHCDFIDLMMYLKRNFLVKWYIVYVIIAEKSSWMINFWI